MFMTDKIRRFINLNNLMLDIATDSIDEEFEALETTESFPEPQG